MSHFIFLNSPIGHGRVQHYRIRADQITWMVTNPGDDDLKGRGRYTTVCVGGKELHVEEPPHVILTYIKNPKARIIPEVDYEYFPDIDEYCKKYGKKNGIRKYKQDYHVN